jgi:uncharacterized membrane protein
VVSWITQVIFLSPVIGPLDLITADSQFFLRERKKITQTNKKGGFYTLHICLYCLWIIMLLIFLSFLCCVICIVCLCPVSCLLNVAYVSGLSILDYPFRFWWGPCWSSFKFSVLCFVCLRPVSCIFNVAYVSVLSIIDRTFGFLLWLLWQ